jgi:transcription antitermination factor NusG
MCCEPNKKKDLKQNYFEGYFMINGNPQQYMYSQLQVQSVPNITDVVSSNLDQGEVYNIMW